MNEIDRTGKMYVVWHRRPDVQSRQDGIDQVIGSIVGNGAEYGAGVDGTERIVRNAATDHFDSKERGFNPLTEAKQGSKEYRQAVREFGQRAVYEVQVRYVGSVNAEGKFTKLNGGK